MKGALLAVIFSVLVVLIGCHRAVDEVGPEKGAPGVHEQKLKVVTGLASPESVVVDQATRRFFVSNVGAELRPSDRDGDGFITELSADGEIVEKRFLPLSGETLNAPKGMALNGSTLYITDIDRVLGFDINSREKVFELDFSEEMTAFLNDLVLIDEDTLLVSSTDLAKIFAVNLTKEPSYKLFVSGIPGANGMYFDPHSSMLFVVGLAFEPGSKGSIGVVSLSDDKPVYRELVSGVGSLDGVALVPDYGLVVSDWGTGGKSGRLISYLPSTAKLTEIRLAEEVRGPADFLYDYKSGKLWLPRMLEGKLNIVRLGG